MQLRHSFLFLALLVGCDLLPARDTSRGGARPTTQGAMEKAAVAGGAVFNAGADVAGSIYPPAGEVLRLGAFACVGLAGWLKARRLQQDALWDQKTERRRRRDTWTDAQRAAASRAHDPAPDPAPAPRPAPLFPPPMRAA